MSDTVAIARLGAGGDGIVEEPGRPLYVPFALPGERVTIAREGRRGRVLSRQANSAARIAPFCPYFETCGGCVAQHMAPGLYQEWKRGIVAEALAAARLAVTPDDLVDAHGAGRRRITLHARFNEGRPRIGFMAARSHDLVEIAACPVAEPRLASAVESARGIVALLGRRGKPLDIQATATEAGLDLDIRGHGPLDRSEQTALIDAAERLDLARLSAHGDTLVERRVPVITTGSAVVTHPPGGFLQATQAGEQVLAALVVEAAGSARRVADLYAGCGPFALRLAEGREVHAVDQQAESLAALDKAARATPGLRRITVETRDLHRRPLLAPELARFDAVVLDPPRAGAEAQCRQLALSAVPLAVMVSCDPGTFARDAAIMVGAGFQLERVVPVDQFKCSAHVELVGLFRRPTSRKRRR